MKKISERDIQIIQYDYKNGLSENQIAKKTHLSKGTISKYLQSDKFNLIKIRNKVNSYKKIYIIAANKKLRAKMRKIKAKATITPNSISKGHKAATSNPTNQLPVQDRRLESHLNSLNINNLTYPQLSKLFNSKNQIYKKYTTKHSTLLTSRLQELERTGQIKQDINDSKNSGFLNKLSNWFKK